MQYRHAPRKTHEFEVVSLHDIGAFGNQVILQDQGSVCSPVTSARKPRSQTHLVHEMRDRAHEARADDAEAPDERQDRVHAHPGELVLCTQSTGHTVRPQPRNGTGCAPWSRRSRRRARWRSSPGRARRARCRASQTSSLSLQNQQKRTRQPVCNRRARVYGYARSLSTFISWNAPICNMPPLR